MKSAGNAKLFFFVIAAVFGHFTVSTSASADPLSGSAASLFSLPANAQALVPLKTELVSAADLYAPVAPGANPPSANTGSVGTILTLKFVLPGCLDVLAPVRTKAVPDGNGKLDLYVSAEAVSLSTSENVRCFVANTAKVTIVLNNQFFEKADVRVIDLGF